MSDERQRQRDWEQRYRAGRTAWDRGGVSPALEHWLGTGQVPAGRVLVPGCGHGHEVAELVRAGRQVTAVDIAAQPVMRLVGQLNDLGLHATVIQADLLNPSTRSTSRPASVHWTQAIGLTTSSACATGCCRRGGCWRCSCRPGVRVARHSTVRCRICIPCSMLRIGAGRTSRLSKSRIRTGWARSVTRLRGAEQMPAPGLCGRMPRRWPS